MGLRVFFLAVSLVVVLAGCGSADSDTTAPQGMIAFESVVDWQSLGCAEPPPLSVELSDALQQDVGSAAPSLAETFGISIEEAQRRLGLQEVLGQAMAQVQAAEAGRVASSEFQHRPTYRAIVTLTGTDPVSEVTRDILCRTPELRVEMGGTFTQDELAAETARLAPIVTDAVPGLTSFGPRDGELEFEVIDDVSVGALAAVLRTHTTYPYTIVSQGLPPLVLDPSIPFPLLDTTGRASMLVGLSGVLTIDGPCVYVADMLQVLPARETQWDAAVGVLNTGGGDMRSGDLVTGGGGPYRGLLDDLDQPPDSSCRTEGGLFVGTFAPASSAPPEPSDAPSFSLDPSNPQAGEVFDATFDADNQRGGFFYLSRWQGSDWSEPQFLLESGANSASPTVLSIEGEEVMMQDYGVGGAGPDELLMPDDIEPGQWRLCTANAGRQICTQITVDAG